MVWSACPSIKQGRGCLVLSRCGVVFVVLYGLWLALGEGIILMLVGELICECYMRNNNIVCQNFISTE